MANHEATDLFVNPPPPFPFLMNNTLTTDTRYKSKKTTLRGDNAIAKANNQVTKSNKEVGKAVVHNLNNVMDG